MGKNGGGPGTMHVHRTRCLRRVVGVYRWTSVVHPWIIPGHDGCASHQKRLTIATVRRSGLRCRQHPLPWVRHGRQHLGRRPHVSLTTRDHGASGTGARERAAGRRHPFPTWAIRPGVGPTIRRPGGCQVEPPSPPYITVPRWYARCQPPQRKNPPDFSGGSWRRMSRPFHALGAHGTTDRQFVKRNVHEGNDHGATLPTARRALRFRIPQVGSSRLASGSARSDTNVATMQRRC